MLCSFGREPRGAASATWIATCSACSTRSKRRAWSVDDRRAWPVRASYARTGCVAWASRRRSMRTRSFPIGSTTKAFTSALLATLVDEGKLTWDTKVVGRAARVQDVRPVREQRDDGARSARPSQRARSRRRRPDVLSSDDSQSRERSSTSCGTSSPRRVSAAATPYDNLLYVVAGQVIEAVAGASWEDVMRQRILDPLQMKQTSTSSMLPPGRESLPGRMRESRLKSADRVVEPLAT